jgi:hypothetical protein
MTVAERAAYEKWVNARPNRYGSSLLNAYLAGRRDRHREHIEVCPSGCIECADDRAFGPCTSCGADTEAIGPDELSRCCGSRVLIDREMAS